MSNTQLEGPCVCVRACVGNDYKLFSQHDTMWEIFIKKSPVCDSYSMYNIFKKWELDALYLYTAIREILLVIFRPCLMDYSVCQGV